MFIGLSESDLPHEISTNISDDPLDIAVHKEPRTLKMPRKQNYKCSICSTDICSIVFPEKFALEYHYSKFHEGKKPEAQEGFQLLSKDRKMLRQEALSIDILSLKRHSSVPLVHEGKTTKMIETFPKSDGSDGNNLNGHQDNSEIILPD